MEDAERTCTKAMGHANTQSFENWQKTYVSRFDNLILQQIKGLTTFDQAVGCPKSGWDV